MARKPQQKGHISIHQIFNRHLVCTRHLVSTRALVNKDESVIVPDGQSQIYLHLISVPCDAHKRGLCKEPRISGEGAPHTVNGGVWWTVNGSTEEVIDQHSLQE